MKNKTILILICLATANALCFFRALGDNFTYQALPFITSSTSDFIVQANSEGANGYKFFGGYLFGTECELYVKVSSPAATFSYQALPFISSSTSDFIAQANAEGANGYKFFGGYLFGTECELYVKDSSQAVTYTYQALPFIASSTSDFIAQANAEGVNGYMFYGGYLFGTQCELYVKTSSPAATYNYQALPFITRKAFAAGMRSLSCWLVPHSNFLFQTTTLPVLPICF